MGAFGFALFLPVVACETDATGPGGLLSPPGFEVPDAAPSTAPTAPTPTSTPEDAAPPTPKQQPDAAPPDASSPDAAVEAGPPPPACNDGKVDPGETCDPLASCPTACAQVQCQLRTLEKPGTCEAKCVNAGLQTACVNGDGCCPPGCNKTNDDDCGVVCGNGTVEPGETCDPLASCPASCPALGCQLRILDGAGTCAAKCVNAGMQTACINNDGCCPAGCNATNDSDCGAGCGNNVVEPGETCDPLASCPTVCPPNKCQIRTLQNAGTCKAQCVDAGQQTACINNDGCCPAGCNANNDNDCTPVCGNGVVEKNETCDPLGSCPASCPQVACQLRKLDNGGTCQAVCSPAGLQTACVNGDGCCPNGCNANNDSDCKPVCGNKVVESGELCDGNCPVACAKTSYTCYEQSGSAATCDLTCNSPVTKCGSKGDSCCPFDGAGGCGLKTDDDCNGDAWQWMAWPTAIDTSKGCVQVVVRGIVPGGSYELTTCAPPGSGGTGTGDPDITAVVDDSSVSYGVANADCTEPTALPHLAKSDCKNKEGKLTMACASPSPGGFIAGSKASAFTVTICPGKDGAGTTPLYVWYNASKAPTNK